MDLAKFTLVFFFAVAIAIFVFGAYRNFNTQRNANQKIFLKGTLPQNLPDGSYKGAVKGLNATWIWMRS